MKKPSRRLVPAMLGIVCVASAVCTQNSAQLGQRPAQYPASWSQFFVNGWADPRVVTMLRLGAGPDRHAEFTAFELVDNGQRLRRLYKSAVLRNELVSWAWLPLGHGRFLVTFDDRYLPSSQGYVMKGSTDNALVIYDLARQESVARRPDEFLPEEYLRDHRSSWCGVGWLFDPLRQLFYPTALDETEGGTPFLTVDLPSLSVRYSPVPPARLPEEVVTLRGGSASWWEWSMGRGNNEEPAWAEALALPNYLKGTAVWDLERLRPIWGDDKTTYFKLDPDSGEYMRCPAEEWPGG